MSLVYHVGSDILVNGRNIWHEIQAARSAYKSKNWFKFGEDTGQALALVFFGKNDPGYKSLRVRVAEILKGMIEGAFDQEEEVRDDIKKCLSNGNQMYDDFKSAVINFELKT